MERMKEMKKNWMVLLSMLLALALVFTGCGGGNNDEVDELEGTEVTEGAIQENVEDDGGEAETQTPEEETDSTGGEQQTKEQKPATEPEKKPEQKPEQKPEVTPVPTPTPAPQPEPTPTPTPEQPPAQEPVVEQPPAEEPAPPQEESKAPTKADAAAYIGSSKSALINGIGAPNSSSYAPSCIGEGEDGELRYNGFTVYTYRENGSETVTDVL